jgi:uncharacterized protein (DUF58 family)
MKIHKNFWIAVAIFILMVAASQFFQHMIFSRFAYLTVLIILTGVIWTGLSLRGIIFQRSFKDSRYECGQVFEENYQLENDSFIPKAWLKVDDLSNLPSKPASNVITLIKPHQNRYYQTMLILTDRGEYTLGPTIISSGDPFGFFEIRKIISNEKKILVLPLIFPLDSLKSLKGNLTGGRARRESITDTTPNSGGVRDYRPGDPLNRIHWKTSIRQQRWFVREFDQDPHSNLWLFLDGFRENHIRINQKYASAHLQPREVHFYKSERILPVDNFEYSVSIAASMSQQFLKDGRAVGLICAGQNNLFLSPEKGERQIIKILENLSYIMPLGKLPYAALVQTNAELVTKGNSLVLITSSWDVNLQTALDMLIRRSIPIYFVYMEPTGFGGLAPTKEILIDLQNRGIPTTVIKPGDDISFSLGSQIWGVERSFENKYSQ